MDYKNHTDEELRRALLTDPYDMAAICEASDRFAKQNGYTEEDIEKIRQESYEDGYKNATWDLGPRE